jgi:tetratricopeptide (TPR) repeat protein
MDNLSERINAEEISNAKGTAQEITLIPSISALPSWTGSLTVHVILIMLLGLLVYSNTFNVPLLFDDLVFISENPLIKDFGYFSEPSKAEGLNLDDDVTRFFKTRRVGYFTLWASHRLGGLDVTGYHAVNLTVHIINALLVYLIVIFTFRTPLLEGTILKEHPAIIALFSGLLFVAHPIQTETVTYIIKRVVLLASMFYLASTAAYIGSRLSKGKARYGLYALAFLFAVLGMKTKENVFTLPVAIGLYEFMFFRDGIKKRALFLVPLLLTMLIIPLTYINMQKDATFASTIDSATKYPGGPSRMDYLYTQFNVIAKYLGLLFLPAGQNVDHDQPVFHSFFEPRVILSLLLLVLVFSLGIYMLKRPRKGETTSRLCAFGIFWFFLTLSVESSILPIGVMMVEYRTYLPNAGAFLALGTGVFLLIGSLKEKGMRKVLASFLVIVILVLSTATYARNTVWKSDLTLWKDAVRKSPNKARVHNNLGNIYLSKGYFDKALYHLQNALRLKVERNSPEEAKGHINLGNVYLAKGYFDKAIEHYKTALRLDSDLAEAYNNLGNAYYSKGLTNKAIEHYKTALRLNPDYAEAHYNLGHAYRHKDILDKAIEHLQAATRLRPDYAMAHYKIGYVYGKLGMFDRAIEHLYSATRLNPDYAEAHYYLGLAYFEKGFMDRARTEFEAALMLNPSDREAKQLLDQIINLPR